MVLHSHDGYTTNLALEDFAAEDALLVHSWSGAPLDAGAWRPGAAGGAASLFLEEREMAAEHRIPGRGRAGLLGSARLPQSRRSVGRAALFRRLEPQALTRRMPVPTERFQFTGEGGHQLAAALDTAGRDRSGLRAVRALLHLRQGRAGSQAHRRRARRQGHRGAAFRLHRARLQRGRFRQFDLLVQRRRPRARRRSSARNPQGAGDPDRPQPRRRGDPGRRRPDSGSEGGRDHRGAIRSRACHRHLFKDHIDGHPHSRARSRSRSPAGRSSIKREFLDDVAEHEPDGASRQAAQGAAGDAFADRRHRRHRQRHQDLRRGQSIPRALSRWPVPIIC